MAIFFDQYRLLIESVYTLVVVFCCLVIYLKTRRLYVISAYKGMLYFQNAFLWFAIAYVSRFLMIMTGINDYVLFGLDFFGYGVIAYNIFMLIFIYFLSLGGLFLVYSLVWKDFEQGLSDEGIFAWLIDSRIYMLHAIALVVSVLVIILKAPDIMYVTQIALTGYGLLLTYNNYQKVSRHKTKHGFSQLYVLTMSLAFLGYVINFLSVFIFPIMPMIFLYADIITTLIFLIFLYGIATIGHKDG